MKFSVEKNGFIAPDLPKWGSVDVYGLSAGILVSLSVNGEDMKEKATYDINYKVHVHHQIYMPPRDTLTG